MSPDLSQLPLVAVIGGGPAGLRAAEVLSGRAGGAWRVEIFEGKPSVGRKFLVAGRGGLNLTHSEARSRFVTRYGAGGDDDVAATTRWANLLAGFGPEDLRAWATGLGVETFVGTSGRVFPVGKQAAGLLRRWVARLRGRGVVFHVRHRWEDVTAGAANGGWRLGFRTAAAGRVEVAAAAVVFALGGASWPDTGSDGGWTAAFRGGLGVPVAPWEPANCGWEVAWRPEFLDVAEGQPLKNLALRAGAGGGAPVRGEALVTRYGLEGGAVYQLGPALRAMGERPGLRLDLKPDTEPDALANRLPEGAPVPLDLVASRWRLAPAARALLEFHGPGSRATRAAWLGAVKDLALPLRGPRPVAEAISSAGGVRWAAVDGATLGLRASPGIFLAGEMLDWEAPTGGYLLQGCFATGTRAGWAAAEFLEAAGRAVEL